jgi:predicted nucleic acid-binding protein
LKKAFADTSGLYALLVRTEDGHADVVTAFERLLKARRELWTTSYVLVETIALLQHRIGLAPIRDLIEKILPLFSVDWISSDLHLKGVERLLREDKRRLSLVDCVSFEFLRSAEIEDVLGLDPHFEAAGFRLLPKRKK